MTANEIRIVKTCERIIRKQNKVIRDMAKRSPLLFDLMKDDMQAIDKELAALRKLLRKPNP